jgi:hypothetical protein
VSAKLFYKVAGTVFGIISFLHLARVIFGWNFVYANISLPAWLSLVAFVILAFLSYTAFKLAGVFK